MNRAQKLEHGNTNHMNPRSAMPHQITADLYHMTVPDLTGSLGQLHPARLQLDLGEEAEAIGQGYGDSVLSDERAATINLLRSISSRKLHIRSLIKQLRRLAALAADRT